MGVYKRVYKRRTRKDASVWYFQFMFRKTRFVESGFPTEKAALEAERKKLNELKSKKNRAVSKERVSFSMWLPRFIESRRTMGKAPRTIYNEASRGKAISRHFGNRCISEIEAQDIEDFVAIRQKAGISPRTINLELTFLRSFFRHAIQNHLAAHNPAREITNIPDGDRPEVWIPTQEEFGRFVKAAESFPAPNVFANWVWFRALTGTRPSEACFLEWEDIDFEKELIWIRPKNGNPIKTRKRRCIPLHPDLKPIMLKWRKEWTVVQDRWIKRNRRMPEEPPHRWVFFNSHNYDERARCFRRFFDQAKKKADLPLMTPYTLRHYFISQSIMNGIKPYTISKWVGHRDTLMVERVYGHITQDFSAGEMAKVRVVAGG